MDRRIGCVYPGIGGDPKFPKFPKIPEAFFKLNESVWVLVKSIFVDGEFLDVLIYAWRNKPTLDELAKDAGLGGKPYRYLKGILDKSVTSDYILKEFKRGEKGSVH